MLLDVAPGLRSCFCLSDLLWVMAYSPLGYSYSTTPQVQTIFVACFFYYYIYFILSLKLLCILNGRLLRWQHIHRCHFLCFSSHKMRQNQWVERQHLFSERFRLFFVKIRTQRFSFIYKKPQAQNKQKRGERIWRAHLALYTSDFSVN